MLYVGSSYFWALLRYTEIPYHLHAGVLHLCWSALHSLDFRHVIYGRVQYYQQVFDICQY